MTYSLCDRTDFYGALTLAERAALPERPAAGLPTEAARNRLQRWRSQPPFAREDLFARRLAQDGLDEEALLALLGEPREALARRVPKPPEWLRDLDEAFRSASSDVSLPFSEEMLREPETRFLSLASPLIERAERRVAEAASALAASGRALPFDPATIVPLLFPGLAAQLLWTITRVAVLELNVARLEERVAGATPEERFERFIELLRSPAEALEILARYPVLAQQLAVRIRNWSDASIELLSRLAADWDDIRATLAPVEDPGRITEVRSGAGDRHRGGRTVCILTFASNWQLVYKPRAMAVAAHFQDLLDWMNQRGFTPAFRRLGVLDRRGYGWMEFAAAAPCAARGEVQRFYQRMGGYLALLYALDASDFHYENLIAAGEHPVLIDLESIVQPRAPVPDGGDSDWLASEAIGRSVLRIGLLPQRAWGGAGEGIDVSGLGAPAGQLSADQLPYWEDRGTDTMRLQRRRMQFGGGSHTPTLGDAAVEVVDYVEELVDGFTRAYRLLATRGGELLAAGGPLARMADDEVRIILRPTRSYAHLLQESFHPLLLRDALERDRHFDHLWHGVLTAPAIEQVLPAERRELLTGDIPLFTARLDGRDLLGAEGQLWPEFFERSGLDLVRSRLAELGESDLARQVWFVRASLAAHHINLYGTEDLEALPGPPPGGTADSARLIEAAAAVGNRLEALALRSEGDANWIGLRSHQGRDWRLSPLGGDLYSGLPGVAVFLAYLAEVTGEERYRRLARAAWQTLWRHRERHRSMPATIGGFDGWGGLLWTLTHLARLWSEPAYREEAAIMVELLPKLIAEDERYDVVQGAAGCIAGLLALYRTEPSDRVLEVAAACGEHLLARARRMERGVGWMPAVMERIAPQPLAGFAHGASGIAWALLELAAVTGEDRFRRAALDAVDYERTLFVPSERNWRDVRELERTQLAKRVNGNLFMLTWCHGAPGIGLARLRALRHLDDRELRAEAEIALASTLAGGFGTSHCLCHGDLGNVELLLQATEVLDGDGAWREEANRVGERVLASIAQHGWRSGMPRAVEVPGLMMGLAGIGYGLLRLALPERVPSVLLLEPPIAA